MVLIHRFFGLITKMFVFSLNDTYSVWPKEVAPVLKQLSLSCPDLRHI